MKFENLMLQTLFSACLLICVLTLGTMLTARVSVPNVAANHAPAAANSAG